MMRNRIRMFALCLSLLLLFVPLTAVAEGADAAWWEEDIWSAADLTSLGAVPPAYNASEQRYEIETPEQLLFLSGYWKPDDQNGDGVPDAPCNGVYVLTADLDMAPLLASVGDALTKLAGTKVEGYMPPIAASADETEEGGEKCAFFGTFDGQGHAIQNLRVVRKNDKYAGLFGNIGHDYGEGYVKNLALINMRVEALASCGLLAGAVYGDVDNCVLIGTVDCLEKTAGGVAGKVKKNDRGYVSNVRNCFVYADITVRGQGDENGAAGGVTSAQSDGGRVYNCFVAGSLTVLGEGADCVGGLTGNLKSGQALENNVMLLRSIAVEDGTHVGLLCGDYSGETGSHLINNLVWEGTLLTGSVTSDHPEAAAFATVTAAELQNKETYSSVLGWDADTWAWLGDDKAGIPMPAAFAGKVPETLGSDITAGLAVTAPVLRAAEPMTNSGYEGDETLLTCTLRLPDGMTATGAKLLYGTEKDPAALTATADMTDNGDGTFSVAFPEQAVGAYYYIFTATAGGQALTFPTQGTLRMDVVSAAAKYAPEQVVLSPGATYDTVNINWTTEADGLTGELRYRAAGGSEWTVAPVTEQYRAEISGGRGAFTSYSVDVTGLEGASVYEYMAVTNDGTRDYAGGISSFTTLPDGNGYSFMVVSDLQATAEEGYEPFLYTMDGFVKETLGGVGFVVNLGDLTEDGSSLAQWRYMFDTLGGVYGSTLTAFVAGNHESKGDPDCTVFEGATNLPGGMDDRGVGETTGSFIVGDVCFVLFNSEPYSGQADANIAEDKAAYYELQKAWAKDVFEASGCTWRVIAAHAGLIQDDPAATAFIETMCDELDVDLYFNGHIHDYYRATVKDGAAAEVGQGTTFITTSPMGCKFDDFIPGEIDDLLQFQTGGSDDERQYFTYVTVTDEGLSVTAYQRTEAGEPEAKLFADYTAIDSFTLKKAGETPVVETAAPAPAAVVEQDPPAPEKTGTRVWLWVGISAFTVLVVVLAVVGYRRKDRKLAQAHGQTEDSHTER